MVEGTKLLSQVLDHVAAYHLSNDNQRGDETQRQLQEEEDELQLSHTITSLITAAEVEAERWGISTGDQIVIGYRSVLDT